MKCDPVYEAFREVFLSALEYVRAVASHDNRYYMYAIGSIGSNEARSAAVLPVAGRLASLRCAERGAREAHIVLGERGACSSAHAL